MESNNIPKEILDKIDDLCTTDYFDRASVIKGYHLRDEKAAQQQGNSVWVKELSKLLDVLFKINTADKNFSDAYNAAKYAHLQVKKFFGESPSTEYVDRDKEV